MKNIVIYGERKDHEISDMLIRLLSEKNMVNYLSYRKLAAYGSGVPINLIEISELNEITLKNCILILKRNARISPESQISKFTDIIIDSSNEKNIEQIVRLGELLPNVYTCGFSGKDYVTFSSRGEKDVVVSLLRGVHLMRREYCEPFEIPCRVDTGIEDYTILACVLTLILIGRLNENISKDLDKIYFS